MTGKVGAGRQWSGGPSPVGLRVWVHPFITALSWWLKRGDCAFHTWQMKLVFYYGTNMAASYRESRDRNTQAALVPWT